MDGPRNGSDLPNAPGQKRRRVSAHWASPLARKPRRLGGRLFVRQPEPGACNARAGLSPGSRRALVVVPALNSCLRIAARPDGDDVVDGDRCCKHRPRRSRVRVGMYNRLGGIHGGKKNTPDDSGAITFSGTFSGTLVGARSGGGAGAGVWAGFGTASGMSIGVEPG